MADHSFDIVSDYDVQELRNAHDQAMREIGTRFDFKGSPANIELQEKELIVTAESAVKLQAVYDILKGKMAKRNVSLKILDMSKPIEDAAGGTVRQHVPLKKGLEQDNVKKITKLIRERHPKVKAQIQGDAIRVVHKDLDELQAVQKLVAEADFDMPLSFTNYR